MEKTGIWKTDDPEWMAERKELWRKVKYSLNIMSENPLPWPVKKKYHRFHKDLFFYGKKVTSGEQLFIEDLRPYQAGVTRSQKELDDAIFDGQELFSGLLPFFELWYHPDPQQLDLEELRLRWLKIRSFPLLWDRYQRLASCRTKPPGMFDPAYGAMGGREELISQLIFPGKDYRYPYTGEGLDHRTDKELQPCLAPKDLVADCLFDTCWELRTDAGFYPFRIGQYLWEHLSYALEHYPDECFVPQPLGYPWGVGDGRRGILVTLWGVQNFETRTDPSRKRPSTIAMVERLIKGFEDRTFSPTLEGLWEEAKGIEPSELERRVFNLGFRNTDIWPAKEQREWKTRWAQV